MALYTASDYTPEQTALVRSAALTAATILGDYMDDMAIIGGLAPILLIPPAGLPNGASEHVGTIDLDLGLDLVILDNQRYSGMALRLESAGLVPDVNKWGRDTFQRWTHPSKRGVKIEFLIPPANEQALPGRLQHIEHDLAAFIIAGLELAFINRQFVELSGQTLFGEEVTRNVPVCNPGAFVVLKALAFRNRGKSKDAYDLFYMIRNYGHGIEDVAGFLRPLLQSGHGQKAMSILREDFLDERRIGPMRAAQFLDQADDPDIKADVVGHVSELLRATGA